MDRLAHGRTSLNGLVAGACLAVAALAAALSARADISPEFQSVLNDVSGDFKVAGPELKDCDGAALALARQAMQRRFISNAMAGPVVVSAFENACKPVLDAFGLGYVGTTYSVAKCAWQYLDGAADTQGFGACLAAEGVSYLVGKAFERVGLDDAVSAGLNVPAGKGLDALKGMIAEYHAAGSRSEFDSEEYGPAEGFPCQVQLSVRWSKPANPVRADGSIVILVSLSGCDCGHSGTQYASGIESGSVMYRVPVKFWNDNGKPAWYVDNAHTTLRVASKCCGRPSETVHVYSHDGTLLRTGTPPVTTGGTTTGGNTTGPVTPPAPPPKPPVKPTWPGDTGAQLALCPECAQIAHDIDLTRQAIAEAESRVAGLAQGIVQNQASQAALSRRIAELQATLDAQAGTGGSALDTTTGVTTSAVTQPDGTVQVTTTGPDGQVLERHTRPRRDLAKARDEMAGLQKQLEGLKSDAASLEQQLARARARRDGLAADLAALQQRLAVCLANCRERLTGESPVTVETVHNIAGNNPFDPRDPLGGTSIQPQPPGSCTTPRPGDETQTLACPAGQTGSITQTRTYSCVGATWAPGPFTTTRNTCSSAPTGCTGPQPPPDTQMLSCPAGQTGSITQTRTYSCVGTTWTPGPFTTTSNTCTAAPSGCATSFSSGNYSCSGTCGIASTGLSVTPGSATMTASGFGANPSVTFSCVGSGATSTGNNLTILGAPGHTCSLSGFGMTSFGLSCTNTSGGSCSSSCSR
jgi:hypothetical protein